LVDSTRMTWPKVGSLCRGRKGRRCGGKDCRKKKNKQVETGSAHSKKKTTDRAVKKKIRDNVASNLSGQLRSSGRKKKRRVGHTHSHLRGDNKVRVGGLRLD